MTGPNLSENAEGARALALTLKERGNYWRAQGHMNTPRLYFNAAVALQRCAVELETLFEIEQNRAEWR